MSRLSNVCFSALMLFSVKGFSQSNKMGTWGIATVVLPSNVDHRWGGYFETQARSDELAFNRIFYNEFKTGVSYAVNNNYVLLMGTGHYTTYDYANLSKGPTIRENRLWEQVTFTQFLSRIKFEHRYRVEQRWVNSNYRNRFRYRLNAVVPINNQKMGAKTVFVSVFDEIFLNNKQPNFERNRFSASLGYQFTKSFTVQTGWLNQYNNTLTSTNDKNNLLLNFIYQIQRKKPSTHEELPTLKD
jgi:hypothetical protein